MIVEEFMKRHPVPVDAYYRNKRDIELYQNTSDEIERNKIVGRLLETNNKVIGIVYKRYGNKYDISELFIILYDVIHLSARAFDLEYFQKEKNKNKFVTYVIYRFYSYMQNYLMEDRLIHVPANRSEEINHNYIDMDKITDVVNKGECDYSNSTEELRELISDYKKTRRPNSIQERKITILEQSLDLTFADISQTFNISRERVRQLREEAIKDLKSFKKYCDRMI